MKLTMVLEIPDDTSVPLLGECVQELIDHAQGYATVETVRLTEVPASLEIEV